MVRAAGWTISTFCHGKPKCNTQHLNDRTGPVLEILAALCCAGSVLCSRTGLGTENRNQSNEDGILKPLTGLREEFV